MPETPTRDAVLKMPAGPGLDALVAERVMGWRRAGRYGPGHFLDERGACQSAGRWSPSTDIAAAWEVVEKVTLGACEHYPRGLTLHLSGGEIDKSCAHSPDAYTARLECRKWDKYVEADAPTAPLAICRVALLVVRPGLPAEWTYRPQPERVNGWPPRNMPHISHPPRGGVFKAADGRVVPVGSWSVNYRVEFVGGRDGVRLHWCDGEFTTREPAAVDLCEGGTLTLDGGNGTLVIEVVLTEEAMSFSPGHCEAVYAFASKERVLVPVERVEFATPDELRQLLGAPGDGAAVTFTSEGGFRED